MLQKRYLFLPLIATKKRKTTEQGLFIRSPNKWPKHTGAQNFSLPDMPNVSSLVTLIRVRITNFKIMVSCKLKMTLLLNLTYLITDT